jgi:hypothetical protein
MKAYLSMSGESSHNVSFRRPSGAAGTIFSCSPIEISSNNLSDQDLNLVQSSNKLSSEQKEVSHVEKKYFETPNKRPSIRLGIITKFLHNGY